MAIRRAITPQEITSLGRLARGLARIPVTPNPSPQERRDPHGPESRTSPSPRPPHARPKQSNEDLLVAVPEFRLVNIHRLALEIENIVEELALLVQKRLRTRKR